MSPTRVDAQVKTTEEAQANNHMVNQLLTRLEPIFLFISLTLILAGSMLHSNMLLTDGVGILIATPVVIVAASTLTFARQHDYRFVAVGTMVLITIVLSALSELH